MHTNETTEHPLPFPDNAPAREWLALAGGEKIVGLAAAVILAGALAYIALLPELRGLKDYRLLGPAFLIPISLVSLLLLRLGRPLAAYHGLLWGVLLAVTVSSALVAGLRTGIVFAYPAIIVGAMVLGPRTVVLAGAFAIAAVIGLGLAEYAGLLPEPRPSSTFVIGLAYVIVLFILSSVAAAMVQEQKRWRDREASAARALQSSLDALTQRELEIERLNRELEQRVRERTADLASANRELESFAYSISHDLRAPLRGIDGFSQMALEEYGEKLDAQGRGYLERVRAAAQRMGHLIDDILNLSRVSRHVMRQERVDLSGLAAELMEEIRQDDLLRNVEVSIAPGCAAQGDPRLLRVLMQNLLENAWKYTSRQAEARIDFGKEALDTGETVFFVRDNGVGFDMQYADRLFSPFQRLHNPTEYPGSGIGLATVARIAHRHGGRVWVEAEPGKGAVFRFTLAA